MLCHYTFLDTIFDNIGIMNVLQLAWTRMLMSGLRYVFARA